MNVSAQTGLTFRIRFIIFRITETKLWRSKYKLCLLVSRK